MFLIAGPTASGKTDIAVEVALRCNAEIIGADAFQIYEGMEILTAKPSANQLARVPHHLIGSVSRSTSFDVGQFLEAARRSIEKISAKGRLALVVGGTGLYLRALTHGLAQLPKADPSLRAELEELSTAELQRQLAELDPITSAVIDSKNRRRLIRALEVCRLTGRAFSSFRDQNQADVNVRGVCLLRPREELYERINQRTEWMFLNGVIEEARALTDLGPTASQVLGLRQCQATLAGEITLDQAKENIQRATRNYAKRQFTWFKREQNLLPMDLSTTSLEHAVSTIVQLIEKKLQ